MGIASPFSAYRNAGVAFRIFTRLLSVLVHTKPNPESGARSKAISYNKLILKTENGGFSTFAGVFDPGTGRIGPAVLKFRLAFLRDASNGVDRFFRI